MTGTAVPSRDLHTAQRHMKVASAQLPTPFNAAHGFNIHWCVTAWLHVLPACSNISQYTSMIGMSRKILKLSKITILLDVNVWQYRNAMLMIPCFHVLRTQVPQPRQLYTRINPVRSTSKSHPN